MLRRDVRLASTGEASALELLQRENELLRQALEATATKPEDVWSPEVSPAPGGEYIEVLGKPSPIPGHDGTECFKAGVGGGGICALAYARTNIMVGEAHVRVKGKMRRHGICMHCAWLRSTPC